MRRSREAGGVAVERVNMGRGKDEDNKEKNGEMTRRMVGGEVGVKKLNME